MITEGFPENHDNPTTWPYWSPSHRHIVEMMADKKPQLKPELTDCDAKMLENLKTHGTDGLKQTLSGIADEMKNLQASIKELENYKQLAERALAEISAVSSQE